MESNSVSVKTFKNYIFKRQKDVELYQFDSNGFIDSSNIYDFSLNYENGRLEKLVRYNLPNNIIDYRYFADDKNYKLNEFTPINVNGKFITATDACYNMVFDVSNDYLLFSYL